MNNSPADDQRGDTAPLVQCLKIVMQHLMAALYSALRLISAALPDSKGCKANVTGLRASGLSPKNSCEVDRIVHLTLGRFGKSIPP
jgi:hypothetical protein